ncbi:hypothetical protein CPB83DRAFT_849716 [Crepidotus variabilis]|uniref:Uncharacterized protein n=1 Tax=Crepidotus variabilis TaxID=179855 RepID=A0A9P6EMG5_9AGAR|nr:hypothetical protein CPB83DRAFT_849716 [Crepidotus variabilis]
MFISATKNLVHPCQRMFILSVPCLLDGSWKDSHSTIPQVTHPLRWHIDEVNRQNYSVWLLITRLVLSPDSFIRS